MPKFLSAVRLDDSDATLFSAGGAATHGEWMVSGGFAVCDFAVSPACSPRCHCESSFLALGSKARSTLAEVVEVSAEDVEVFVETLTWQLLRVWGAPSAAAAEAAARDEIGYTCEVCEDFSVGVWVTVRRTPRVDGGGVDEQYNVYQRLMLGNHG